MPSSTSRRASAGRVVGRAARGAERLLDPLARLEQVGARLLPARALGVLLPPLSSASRAAWASCWAASRAPSASISTVALGERGPRGGQLALPLLDRGEQRVEAPLRVRHPRLGVGQRSSGDTPSRRAMARP